MSDVPINCPKCGKNQFKVPRTNLGAKDKMTCTNCGWSGTRDQVLAPATKKIMDDVAAELRKAFKR